MKTRYFISASLSVDMTDDRPFARRLHALADLSVAVLHVAALRSGCGAGNQTTNEDRPEGHMRRVEPTLIRINPAPEYCSEH